MSENVASAGLMAPLSRKLTEEEREEWTELLYEQGSIVHINYEGTLAYTDEGGSEYGISFGVSNTYSNEPFNYLYSLWRLHSQFDVTVELDKARPYTCQWYNGADSYMDMMKLDEFLQATGQ